MPSVRSPNLSPSTPNRMSTCAMAPFIASIATIREATLSALRIDDLPRGSLDSEIGPDGLAVHLNPRASHRVGGGLGRNLHDSQVGEVQREERGPQVRGKAVERA